MYGIRRTKCKRKFKYVLLHLVRIIESLVVVCSLGFLDGRFYSALLFSDWAEDIDDGKAEG